MELVELRCFQSNGDAAVAGRFVRQGGRSDETLTISVPERFRDMLRATRDVFLPVLMLPCMKTGESLDLGGEVSGRLLDQAATVQEIYLSWFPNLRPVEVKAARTVSPPPRAAGVGAFFSAGADSFHTLHEAVQGNIRKVDRLTHLLFVRSTAGRDFRGFGQPLAIDERSESDALERDLQEIAQASDTTLLRVDTNVQRLFPDFNWSLYHHGASLAAIALALSGGLGTQIISSGWSYRDVHPWGSHPLTDPLWSTEYLRFIHYGNHVTRAEKIAEVIAEDPLALKYLRVCNFNSSRTNCGRCYKCLRTMIPLDMVGRLSAAATFSSSLPGDFRAAFPSGRGALEDDAVYRLARKLGHRVYMEKIGAIINKRIRRRALVDYMEASPILSRLVAPIRRFRRLLKR